MSELEQALLYIYIYKRIFLGGIIKGFPLRVIILYSGSTLNAYSFLSQKLWVPFIKFIMGPTTSV
jgi:hypothetical protein